jgi:hypothetical protein
MEVRKVTSVLVLLLACFSALGQQAYKAPRILFVLDGSTQMLQKLDSFQTKFDLAKQIVLRTIDSAFKINAEVEFALRVYGHQSLTKEGNCHDSKLEVTFSKDDYTQILLRLDNIKPKGLAPLGFSLAEAMNLDLRNDNKYRQTIIVLSSGTVSCIPSPCNDEINHEMNNLSAPLYTVIFSDFTSKIECLGNHSIISTDEGKYFAVNAILENCKEILMPRNTRYKSNYGNATIPQKKSQFSEVPKQKPNSIEKQQLIIVDSGYLKLSRKLTENDFMLVRLEDGKEIPVRLTKDDFIKLKENQTIKLRVGKYQLANSSTGKIITIINNMISEISLD